MFTKILTTSTTLLLALMALLLTLAQPVRSQSNSSSIGSITTQNANPSRGLQLHQRRGEQDDRVRSMEEVRNCIDADGLEEALRHGIQAISLDKSNGYAYFAVGASIIFYAPENAEDASPYLERAYSLFRIEGDRDGMQMIEKFLEGMTQL